MTCSCVTKEDACLWGFFLPKKNIFENAHRLGEVFPLNYQRERGSHISFCHVTDWQF